MNVTSTRCGTPIRDNSNIIFVTGVVAGTAALVAVSVHTLVAIMQESFGLDDVFALAAEAACLPVTVIQCIIPKLRKGKDTWAVAHNNIYRVLKVGVTHPDFITMCIDPLAANLGLPNFVLLVPQAHQTCVPVLLPSNLSQRAN